MSRSGWRAAAVLRGGLWLAVLILAGGQALAAAITVRDAAGQAVTLAGPARRIVSLAPHVTELLFAAGAGRYLVGTVSFSDYPPEARTIARVGAYDALDLEAILALRPDLVIAWGSGNPRAQVERLRDLGLAVFVSEPRRLEDIPAEIARLGRLARTGAVAEQAAGRFERRRAALRARYGGRASLRVFYQLWDRPLITVTGAHLISDVIRLCGGRNIFQELAGLAPEVGREAVLARDPQVIVASGEDAAPPAWLMAWRDWPALAAVRHGNLFSIPPDLLHRHTPRILEGAQLLCGQLEEARQRQGLAGMVHE